MNFRQLYYTSCRTGLSGYAGYQFNAVTPGVSPEVMNEVESLGAYEPPGTLGHSPTPEEIDDCPVNLCFVPGPEPIVANVTFTGTDYSGRFGNYFAHALVPESGGRWRDPLPIELWRAPLWTRQAVADTDLPPLRGPLPAGPLSRASVDDFVDRGGHRRLLPALLAAVERAVLDEERSVVVLAPDADQAAHWIAAVCYLLPPPLAARMSFATYQFRPSYSRHHVIGTVPGADLVADERAFEGFYLFDFTTGRSSEVPAGPLPQLLAAAGAVAAEPLWRQATALARGDEARLTGWHPPAVAAALLTGDAGVGPDDLDVVCAWLGEHAARLDREAVGRIGTAVLGHDAASPAHMTGLADAAHAAGLDDLLAVAEERMVGAHLAGRAEPVRLRSRRGREFAVREYGRLMPAADPDAVLRLLGLAHAHGVSPEPRVLSDCGRVVGIRLLREPSGTESLDAVRRWPELRSGTLAYLDQVAAGDRARLYAVAAGGLDEAVPESELAGRPSLREAVLIARARRDPGKAMDTLLSVLSGRGASGRLDNDLLEALWPSGWSLDEARTVLTRLPDGAQADPVLVRWVLRPLNSVLSEKDGAKLDSYAALCDLLGRSPLAPHLPSDFQERIKAMALVRELEEPLSRAAGKKDAKGTARAGNALLESYGKPETAAAADYLRVRLAVLLPALQSDPLARLLASAPAEIRDGYLTRMARRLDGERSEAVPVAAKAFATAYHAEYIKSTEVADAIYRVLLQRLPEWRKRDLNGVERELRRQGGRLSAVQDFQRWRSQYLQPNRRWRWLPSRPSR